MTTEREAFTAAIRANPACDTTLLVFADWLDEAGESIRAAWLRAEAHEPPKVTTLAGSGSGSGYGNGDGDGNGSGSGSGSGYGNGYGSGSGYGSGYGSGDGDGDGSGSGYGSGYGSGDGDGDGSGSGSGYGSGYGSGDGDGNGNGRKFAFRKQVVHEEIIMPAVGQYLVVRSRDQGCMCGEYQYHLGREVGLLNARQIYSWSGSRLTLVDFASVPGECRLSRVAPGETVMLEACGMTATTPEVERFLREHAVGSLPNAEAN